MRAAVRITGHMVSPAHTAEHGGQAAVVAVVAQDDCPRNSPPILVTWLVGDSGSARFVASNAAQALRKGTPVVLTGHHLEITTHRGMPALRLVGAVHIERPTQPAFTERAAHAA